MDYLQLFLGQIPEAIYFALFIIICKKENIISKNSLSLIGFSLFQYLILAYTFPFNSWFQIIYLITLYVDISFIYKEKFNVLNIIYLLMGAILNIIISTPCYLIFRDNMVLVSLIQKILLFIITFKYFKRSIGSINNFYYNHWNIDVRKGKINPVSFRTFHVIIINILFVVLNLGMMLVPLL